MKTVRYAAVCILLLACGCIKLDHTLTLAKDGSGSVEMNITIPHKSVTQLSAMLKLKKELDKANEATESFSTSEKICQAVLEGTLEDIAKAFKPYEEYGITLSRKKVENSPDVRSVYLKIDFPDIQKASQSDIFAMYGFSIAKKEDGNYVITRPSDARDRKGPAVVAKTNEDLNTNAILDGFEVVIRVRTPGAILKTNAQRTSTYTAVWNFDMSVDENALYNLQNQNFGIVFDGRDVSIPEIKYPPAPAPAP